jgi:hypothetical protein
MPENNPAYKVILHKLDTMSDKIDDIKNIAIENQKTLRGHDDSPGLVGVCAQNARDIERICNEDIKRLEGKSNRNDAIVGAGTIIGSIIGFFFGGKI